MNVLICGVNWLGDACMTMPAIQVFRQRYPQAIITMLSKPPLLPLWNCHLAVDATVPFLPGTAGLLQTARLLRQQHFETAYIFPNSWRAALAPFLAGIPHRIGVQGHHRRLLLSETTQLSPRTLTGHQQWEYVDILQLHDVQDLPPPVLKPNPADCRLPPADDGAFTIGIIPGAARGRSKQWPVFSFVQAARIIRETRPSCRFAVMGTAAEASVCEELVRQLQPQAIQLAGKTSLPELMATLAGCRAVICNDSGGMHLSAAAGTPVAAVFGLTDARKTGPAGSGHHCICAKHFKVSRSIARHDPVAIRALESIAPERVADAVMQILASQPQDRMASNA